VVLAYVGSKTAAPEVRLAGHPCYIFILSANDSVFRQTTKNAAIIKTIIHEPLVFKCYNNCPLR
jgi:hypothetical protein